MYVCIYGGNFNGPKKLRPGANPTTSSYNASAVKVHNSTNSIARFMNKNPFPYFKSSLAYHNAGVVPSRLEGFCIGEK
jgi:hypothetical protein